MLRWRHTGTVTDEPLLRKLQVKHGRSLRLVNAPDGYVQRISPLPDGSALVTEGYADVVQAFVHSKGDVDEHAEEATSAAGIVWMTYPKQSSKVKTDIDRDSGWDALRALGWDPVSQISIDEVWSALRFRPPDDVEPHAR